MNTPILQLLTLADAYCEAVGKTRVAISKRVFNDGKTLDKLQAGADLRTARHQMALRWFSDNWPEGLEWPPDIERPRPVAEAKEGEAA